ncbi:hypothetical protein J1TS5_04180 [Paenibacillus macerans]|uniref:HD-GYP domain-containing protein n=1 Tax=Paenibacillus macerans TaxID=44252 RepID=UPI001B2DB0AB|nr:HD-GYP domain-containing protein [Paenibacillus macerans]GIP08248.1 hypothetical protein J1TS5_04180 [Paenibacillus macerans]
MIFKNVLEILDQVHAERVSQLSMSLARTLDLNAKDIELIGHGALYHDIGKIAIPRSLLESRAKFTETERRMMQNHVKYGLALLSSFTSEEMEAAKTIIASHHERWDGKGYPNGLKGEQIPLYGRIVGICDVFDALTSERPYKSAWPLGKALDYIKGQSGIQFDPGLTESFLSLIYEGATV